MNSNKNTGWIKLNKQLLFNPIWKLGTAKQNVVLIVILLRANFKPNKWPYKDSEYLCYPGEFITSLDSLSNVCGCDISINSIRNTLKRLHNLEFIFDCPFGQGRFIRIIEWNNEQLLGGTGWIPLHRSILQKDIWKLANATEKIILVTLLLLLDNSQQICIESSKLTSLCGRGITIQDINTALLKFASLEEISYEITDKTIIVNFINNIFLNISI